MISFNIGASLIHLAAALRREPQNIGALLGVSPLDSHRLKGGENMLEMIRLVKAIASLIRAIAELIRVILERNSLQ